MAGDDHQLVPSRSGDTDLLTAFDVRTVTIEGLTSVRYLLPVTVGIITVIAPIWSAGLSWSHDTCAFEERFDRYPVSAYRDAWVAGSEGAATFLYSAQLSRAGTLDGTAFISNSFLVQCPRSRPHWRRPRSSARRHAVLNGLGKDGDKNRLIFASGFEREDDVTLRGGGEGKIEERVLHRTPPGRIAL